MFDNNLERGNTPLDTVAPGLVELVACALESVLTEIGLDYPVFFLTGEAVSRRGAVVRIGVRLGRSDFWLPFLVDDLHDVNIGAFDEFEECFVQFLGLIVPYLHISLFIVSFDEGVVGIKLADTLLA
jgi:hypothetical protein